MFSTTINTMKVLAIASVVLALVPWSEAQDQSADVRLGIATGSTQGTYNPMGQDIKTLIEETGLAGVEIKVLETEGTIDNIARVLNDGDTQLAMIQSDALTDPVLSKPGVFNDKSISDLRFVLGLYPEEVHILARRGEFESFRDLDGKKVAMVNRSSGNAITLSNLQTIVGISTEWYEVGGEDAITAILDGDIDAFFYVSGQPVDLFKDTMRRLGDDASRLQFVPIKARNVFDLYGRGQLSEDVYFFLDTPVQTASVQSVMVTANYRQNHPKCIAIGKVARRINDRIGLLENSRDKHEKWRSVSLEIPNSSWTKSDCLKHDDSTPDPKPDELKPVEQSYNIPGSRN